jgi:hypothetical protein
MFRQTWNKYMPVIRILIKKSATGEQTLSMNSTDFMRAAGGRKIKFSFDLQLTKGQFINSTQSTPIAQDLVMLLQEDEQMRRVIRYEHLEFSMNNNFQLRIRNTTPAAPAGITISEEELSDPDKEPLKETPGTE